MREITTLIAYEATKQLKITTQPIETPLKIFDAPVLAQDPPVILPVLRAGLGMVEGFLSLMPSARVGHIGLYRDEDTLEPHFYYFKIPPNAEGEQHYFVCDPMLATGGSASYAIRELKGRGIKYITFICIVAAPEGVERLQSDHPGLTIYSASLDEGLNENGYILPGLGDAGDRLYGTQ